MRVAQIISGMAVLLMLLTWLWLSGTDDEAGIADEAMHALDDFSMAERSLHRDVLSARIGMLRNYDPLVREINTLHEATERLRAAAQHEAEIAAAAAALAAQIDQQDNGRSASKLKTRCSRTRSRISAC